MLLFEIAGGVLLAVTAILSWRYILVFAAVLLALWLSVSDPLLAVLIAAVAVPAVLITTRTVRRENAQRAEDEQLRAWAAVHQAAVNERRMAGLRIH
jgi:membrane protein implicated in regulation of membrane protease activity